MSPVHVIVGDDPRAEQMWASAFTGAVDLYRFDRNVDAFERLTAAEAPIDLVVLTPAQRGPFNLTPAQFIARVLEGPLGSSRYLQNLHVLVVGQHVDVQHPRVMAVSTLDAAIRLVKFGEVESAPRPAPAAAAPVQAPVAAAQHAARSHDAVDEILSDLPFSSSVISRIWEAPSEPAASPAGSPESARRDVQPEPAAAVAEPVTGGGAGAAAMRPVERVEVPAVVGPPALFTRVSSGLVVGSGAGAAAPAQPALVGQPMPVGAPGETIEVETGGLQPARPYQLPNGAGYRGPAVRAGHVYTGAAGGQPVPPALATQVQSMVYGAQVGNPNDPLLTWSSTARAQAAPAPQQPAPAQPAPMQAPVPGAMPAPTMHHQPMPVVPMHPPAGAYAAPAVPHGSHTMAAQAQPSPAAQQDPFLARAEQGGAAVSFG